MDSARWCLPNSSGRGGERCHGRNPPFVYIFSSPSCFSLPLLSSLPLPHTIWLYCFLLSSVGSLPSGVSLLLSSARESTCFAMARFLLPSPRSARRLLFGDGPKIGLSLSPLSASLSPSPFSSLSLAQPGGSLQHYRKEFEDSKTLAKRFRDEQEVRVMLGSLKSPVKRPLRRPGPSIIKRPGSEPRIHARHVSFGEVTVREVENRLDSPPPSPPPPPPPSRRAPAGILKRSGVPSMPGSYPRGVSFGGVTVREIENCLVPTRPDPPPPYARFPAVKGRHPLASPCLPAVGAPRQLQRKYLVEVTSRPPRRGTVIGIAAAIIGVSLLLTSWTCG